MLKLGKLAAAALALCFVPSSAAKAADVYEYNFQSTYAGPHVLNLHLYQPWIKELEEKSGGRLKIHFFMSGALAKPEEAIPGIMNGNLDMSGISPHYSDSVMPYTQALNLPHVSPDAYHATQLYMKAYNEIPEIKAEFDKVGKVFTIWGSDRAAFFSTKGPIMSPDDLKGKRVLIWSGGQVDQIKAWGGIPVQVGTNDTYMGLQRGMGDVFFGPLPVGVAYKVMEVTKDITVIPAYASVIGNAMNHEAYAEMPADLQKIFDESTGEQFSLDSGRLLFEYTNKDMDTMRAAGCTIHTLTPEQYQAFKDADREVLMDFWLKNLKRLGVKDPQVLIDKVYAMSAEIPATPMP